MSQRAGGYTLIELLLAVVIFSGVMGTLFSALAAVRRVETFRDTTVAVTQAAHFAFEPVLRSLKAADAPIKLLYNQQECVTVRGFYGAARDGVLLLPETGKVLEDVPVIVTIDTEPFQDPNLGQSARWVRRDYRLERDSAVSTRQRLVEVTYDVDPADVGHQYPNELNGCQGTIIWKEREQRFLTADNVGVVRFGVRLIPPLVDETTALPLVSAFITPTLTLESITVTGRPVRQVSLGTTITPSFNYGEQRE